MSRVSLRVIVRFACSAALAVTLTGGARAFAVTDPVPSVHAAAGYQLAFDVTLPGGALQQRAYLLYLPSGYDPARPEPYPVVVMYHGLGGSALGLAITLGAAGMQTLADAQGKIVVFPQGDVGMAINTAGYWNVANVGRDDVEFTQQLLDYLLGGSNADASRVYAGGHSNGGGFVHKLGTEDPARFRAIADVAGFYGFSSFYGLPGWVPATPPAGTRLPVFIVHGADDTIVPYGGGASSLFSNWVFFPAGDKYDAWYANNGCTEPSWTALLVGQRSIRMTMCDASASTSLIQYVTVFNHAHRWPTLAQGGYDTVREMLAFFDRQ